MNLTKSQIEGYRELAERAAGNDQVRIGPGVLRTLIAEIRQQDAALMQARAAVADLLAVLPERR